MSNTFVVIMGIATVFVGLISIIFVCMIMSAIVRAFVKGKPEEKKVAPTAPAASSGNTAIADRDRVVVAISAAIAEEIGEDAGAIRIVSLRKV